MRVKQFILNSNNIGRDSVIWNMAGSMLLAFQSVILLMVLTRTVGLVEAGIFTIANANANLFLTIGKFGMRNFQVSDVNKQFTFQEYLTSRYITAILMFLISVLYVLYSAKINNYSMNKSMVIVWLCIFKIPDVIEDVYYAEYQKKGRLDIASKALTIRMAGTILFFGISVIVLRNQLQALIISTCFTTILMGVFLKWTYGSFKEKKQKKWKNVFSLLRNCFPLFAGAFLSFYIGNAPKYAIDSMLTDELQACYGFISMPVFVIGLLNGFIFNPMLYRMSCLWNDRKIKEFLKKTSIQVGIVLLITVICHIGAFFLGVPVLSLLYNTNLGLYKKELLILLLGGGFLGLSGLMNAVITIIRQQHLLLWGYVLVAFLAYTFSNYIVGRYEMLGAAILYVVLMGILCICFLGIFIYGIYRNTPSTK